MARTDANPPMPEFRDDYVLREVDADYLAKAVKPKQFIHIDQSECIMCEGCVDICPWKCIFMVSPGAISEAEGTERPGVDPADHVIFTMPRVAVLRSMLMNHIIHHRGQLSVYLRLNDVPLPSIYGPTADT